MILKYVPVVVHIFFAKKLILTRLLSFTLDGNNNIITMT